MTSLDWSVLNDPLYSNREDSYVIELLNLDNEVEEELEWSDGTGVGVLPGGTLELSNATDTREQARISLVKRDPQATAWQLYRFRISYLGAGFSEPQILSTLMPTAAPETHPSTHVALDLELHGLLAILLRSTMGVTFGIEQGQKVTDWMTEIIAGSGIDQFEVTPSNAVMTTAKSWDVGTTRLRIINDLAKLIGYWGVNTNPEGTVLCTPYVGLDDRDPVFTFTDDLLTGIYMPDWSRERDLLAPNRCTVIQRVEGIWTPDTQTVELPPEHPLSAEKRGYYDDRIEVDVDYVDEATGQARAWEFLMSGLPSEVRTFKHLWVPGVIPNAKVIHRHTGLSDLLAAVQRQTYTLATGGMVESRISAGANGETDEGWE